MGRNTSGLLSICISRAWRSISIARLLCGIRCSTPIFIRRLSMTQRRFSKSISSQLAPRASPERLPIQDREFVQQLTMSGTPVRLNLSIKAGTSAYGRAAKCLRFWFSSLLATGRLIEPSFPAARPTFASLDHTPLQCLKDPIPNPVGRFSLVEPDWLEHLNHVTGAYLIDRKTANGWEHIGF